MQNAIQEFFSPAVHAYSRADALRDGVLVDVSNTAREAGFRFPVAVTRAVWDQFVEVPQGVECQDEDGRLWDIVWMLAVATRRKIAGDRIDFHLYVRNHNRGRLTARDLVRLKAICGPGDDGGAVITIMLPEED